MEETAGFDVVVDVKPGSGDIQGLEATQLTANNYVIMITTDHVSNEAALRIALSSLARYIGMIESRHKCETIFGHFCFDGINEDVLVRVYAPIGLDLDGPTPKEIVVSILAEIIAVRRGGSRNARLH